MKAPTLMFLNALLDDLAQLDDFMVVFPHTMLKIIFFKDKDAENAHCVVINDAASIDYVVDHLAVNDICYLTEPRYIGLLCQVDEEQTLMRTNPISRKDRGKIQ